MGKLRSQYEFVRARSLFIRKCSFFRIVHDSRQAKSSKDRSKTPEDEIQFVEEVIVHSPDFEGNISHLV